MLTIAYIVFISSLFLILYHHVGYPLLLSFFTRHRHILSPGPDTPLNQFTFLIPMHNEAHFIAKKIANLDALDYPKNRFQVLLLDDGSTDNSLYLAKIACQKHPHLQVNIISFPVNRGKVAVFNQVIPSLPESHILFFSDASSTLSNNVLHRANQYFNDSLVGAFCPAFHLKKRDLIGEKWYRSYQSSVQQKEALLGTPIGYPGAGYAIRKSTWQQIPDKTINDDFVMPLQVIAKGYVGIYDTESVSVENEPSSKLMNWHRRIRIGAGNIQQIALLWQLLSPRYGVIAWMFFSGKVIRPIIPWLLILLWSSNLYLSTHGASIFQYLWWAQNLLYLSAISTAFFQTKLTEIISYSVIGHIASLLGLFYLFQLNKSGPWQRANQMKKKPFIHPLVLIAKWIIDKIAALIGVLIFLILAPFIAIGIKLTSPGPILFRQLRVGQTTDQCTKLFFMYKFRTMKLEFRSKQRRWTDENNSRIYSFGRFLRKTHLDELPQFYNILKGDMSLVGPRPEKPAFFPYIIKNIPFYEERLYYVKPGLTGLAQVTYKHDKTIEDVRRKVALDHVYATYLTRPLIWFRVEMIILIKTFAAVLLGRGH